MENPLRQPLMGKAEKRRSIQLICDLCERTVDINDIDKARPRLYLWNILFMAPRIKIIVI